MTDYQRFNIKEDDTLKTLDLFHNNIVIQNESENKIIIDLSSIIEIVPVKGDKKQVSMKYYSNGIKNTLIFSTDDRDSLLSKVITMKDRVSKIISDYSIETFKCYNLIKIDSQLLTEIGQKLYEISQGKSTKLSLKNPNLNEHIAFFTLYRTYSVINKLSSKEIKIYYINLSKILKMQIAPNIYGLILEDISKIRIAIIPFNQKDFVTIKNLIISYASKYLNYEIKYEESNDFLKEISMDLSVSKSRSTVFKKNKNSEKNNEGIEQHNININNDYNIKNNLISELMISKKTISTKVGKMPEIYKEINQDNYLFSYNNIRRILFNNDKSEIILKGYYD